MLSSLCPGDVPRISKLVHAEKRMDAPNQYQRCYFNRKYIAITILSGCKIERH